jgi:hypothetical protein
VPLGGPFFYDARAQGVTENGFTFERDGGVPRHMSPFNLTGFDPGTGIPTFDPRQLKPTTAGDMWNEMQAAYGAITQSACANPQSPEEIGRCQALAAALPSVLGTAPPVDGAVDVVAATLDLQSQAFVGPTTNLAGISDVAPLEPTIWQTFEIGYKGLLLGNNLLLGANAYFTDVDNFVSALEPFTPNVFLDGATLAGYLISEGVAPEDAQTIASAVGSAETASGFVGLPLGVMAPTTAGGTTASPILLTYRNLGDFNYFGADASLTYILNERWELGGTISWVEKDVFLTGDPDDPATREVALNAPRWKGSLIVGYREPGGGLSGAFRGRYVDGFPVASGVYTGEVDAYTVFDLNVGYMFTDTGVGLQLDITNVFDNDYQSFVGVPNFGRYAMLRMIWSTDF